MNPAGQLWRIWIDTGGTFTDAVAIDPLGCVHRVKVLSTAELRGTLIRSMDPLTWQVALGITWSAGRLDGYRVLIDDQPDEQLATITASDSTASTLTFSRPVSAVPPCTFTIRSDEDAPMLAARLLTGTPLSGDLPASTIRLATTRGTNALLEREGAPTALFTTRGFADLLRIGTQDRPDLFALAPSGRNPLHVAVVEVDEQIDAAGRNIKTAQLDSIQSAAANLLTKGIHCAAIAFKNSYLNPQNEQKVKEFLLKVGFTHVTASTDLSALIRLVHRAQSALVNATLAPIIEHYLDRIVQAAGRESILVMTSAGGLVPSTQYKPAQSLLSGPAGGVTGAALVAAQTGERRFISFDMGGTSTDVARYDNDLEYTFEHQVGQARLLAPALRIESIAAGGGSLCWFDGHRLRIGPQSAGSDPGPACYGRGGPLTLTDINVLLGRVDVDRFQFPLNITDAQHRADELGAQITQAIGEPLTIDALCRGCIDIADESMADAIRTVSLRRGYDPADHTLIAFGGAGGQHACGIAQRLGITRIIVPADSGLLSAVGLGAARLERFAHRQILRPLDDFAESELADLLAKLQNQALLELQNDLTSTSDSGLSAIRRRIFALRLLGQDATITIESDDPSVLPELFAAQHKRLFGYAPAGRIELESIRIVASLDTPLPELHVHTDATNLADSPPSSKISGFVHHQREALVPGSNITGPALIVDHCSTTIVQTGWECALSPHGHLVITTIDKGNAPDITTSTDSIAVQRELFVRRFVAIVTEMGELLRRTARSTNIKERLDFSCAILDPDGRLVVNAPHIPVHLGALGVCVRSVREVLEMKPGDTIITNHPAHGGSHLPDITLITPVHDDRSRLLGYVANRAHHAEIGGQRAGSMPPNATNLAEEGIVIEPMHLVYNGQAQWNEIRSVLSRGPFPSRDVETNLADLSAALAANRLGANQLHQLASLHSPQLIADHMNALRDQSADHVRAALKQLSGQTLHATESLDDGTSLAVTISVCDGRATFDFTGSSPTHPGNLNATPAIVNSAVMYVLRLLVHADIPLNEGLIDPVQLIIPSGTILNPVFSPQPENCPAVVGGNTETSQRLVDTLLKALDLAACSQGTMNNVLFGDDSIGYYETIAGGAGATADRDGASAIHTHMTNTRITDPEILEHRYPVTIDRFAIRRGSGGSGQHPGGDGVEREITFHAPLAISVLTQHRTVAPYGLHGGQPGAVGKQWIERANGDIIPLSSIDGCDAQPGDRLIIHTPGGGGYGKPAP